MPDQNPFTLRQVDLARADFAAIEDHLDFIKAQLARTPLVVSRPLTLYYVYNLIPTN
jgi:hypothetical protein